MKASFYLNIEIIELCKIGEGNKPSHLNRTITKLVTCLCTMLCMQHALAQHMSKPSSIISEAGVDSSIIGMEKLATKYLSVVDNKLEKYNKAVSSKIESSLTKLAKWEQKIKGALEKVDPPTAVRLFGNNQTTFQSLLEKYIASKKMVDDYTAQFNHYQDKLTTQVKYLQTQQNKIKQKGKSIQMDSLLKAVAAMNNQTDNAEYLETFIKERRKQLVHEAYLILGKSKYLTKLNKESFYYIESIKNYKAILTDPQKTEELVASLLRKIPAFKDFAAQNSQLSGVFPSLNTLSLSGAGNIPIVNGLASRTSVQQNMTNSGMNAAMLISQLQSQTPESGMEISALRNKLENAKETLESLELPSLKVNRQKAKTFKQRIQTDLDVDFGKSTNYLPARANTTPIKSKTR